MGSRFYWDKVVAGLYETTRGRFRLTVASAQKGKRWDWLVHAYLPNGLDHLVASGETTSKGAAQRASLEAVADASSEGGAE